GGRRRVRGAEGLEGQGIERSLFVVSSGAKIDRMTSAVLFAGGSVDFLNDVGNWLIVCDGDFTAQDLISSCLIIARGTIRCDGNVRDERLGGCGKVEFRHPERVFGSWGVENEGTALGWGTSWVTAEG